MERGETIIDYEEFVFKVPCSRNEFEIAKSNAKKKLEAIISRFGAEDGERLTERYLSQLITEELRAQRVSKIMFSVFTDKIKKVRGAIA